MEREGWPSYPQGTENGQAVWGQPPANPVPVVQPSPLTRQPSKRLKLETAAHVRRELARIYREARCDEISTQTATRLAYLLEVLSRQIERTDLEKRIEALEEVKADK
jgi:hypothetical protein